MTYVIGCDVDDVCCDLLSPWLSWYNRTYADTLVPADVKMWDWTSSIVKCSNADVLSYLHQDDYYATDVKPIAGALAGINALRAAGHRIIFITASPAGSTAPAQKQAWLIKHGFMDKSMLDDYIATNDKSPLAAICDMMIDDKPSNITPFNRGMLFNQPWNVSFNTADTNIARVSSWTEIVNSI